MSFTEITGAEYTQLLMKRLSGEVEELTWLRQLRQILGPTLAPGTSVVDVGCATGYAYNSLRSFGVKYVGVDIERTYLDIARQWFTGNPAIDFVEHDINAAAPPVADVAVCSATLEHCPELMPALRHLVDAARRVVVLRSFFGDCDDIHFIPSPVAEFRTTHRKYTNQYALRSVLEYLDSQGLRTKVYRDAATDSIPQLVDRALRTFYVVYGEKRATSVASKP